MKFHEEPARQTPVVDECDVLVAGGGPAGVAAALAAAWSGARVCLLEVHGCLGGVWTAGLLTWILDKDNKPGVMARILAELDARGARNLSNAYDTEVMKRILEQLCCEAGVDIRLHTRVVDVGSDALNRLSLVVTESKSGREAWKARVFVDCTGDGDLAKLAGCKFAVGREPTGETQPMTLMSLLSGVRYQDLHARRICRGPGVSNVESKEVLLRELERASASPSYALPTLFPIREDLFGFMANHVYGRSGLNAQDLTDATLAAREEIHAQVQALRQLGGVWKNLQIVATGEQIGVREGRRIRGRYTVTADDLRTGRLHEDAVCRVTFHVDVHTTNPDRSGNKSVDAQEFQSRPYDIPYRALLAKDVDGLLLAGRCISGDFLAHSSYRVTGNAVAMGQAAGIAAALACKLEKLPHELDWNGELLQGLNRLD